MSLLDIEMYLRGIINLIGSSMEYACKTHPCVIRVIIIGILVTLEILIERREG